MKKRLPILVALVVCFMLTILAACIAPDKEFTVTFKVGDTTVHTETVKENECVSKLPEYTKTGDEIFDGWFANDNAFTETTPVTSDLTVIAKIHKEYTVIFKKGNDVIDTKTVKENDVISSLPQCPTAENEHFDGWFNGENEFTSETPVTSDLTVIAKTHNEYTVTFKNGDDVIDTKTVKENDTVSTLPQCPTAEDESFIGWFNGNDEFTSTTPVTSNLTLTAKIKHPYTVTFKVNDTTYDTYRGKENTTVDLYDYSTFDYEIHEWTDENGVKYNYDDLYIIMGDVTLTAVNPIKTIFTMQKSLDGTYYIVSGLYDTSATEITIPSTYFNLPVKEIAARAFVGYNNTLTSLVVPDTIEKIGSEAFGGLYGLKELTVPFIGEQKFTNVSGNLDKGLFAYWFIDSTKGNNFNNTYSDYYIWSATVYYAGNGEQTQENVRFSQVYVPISLTKLTVNDGAISDYSFHSITTIETLILGDKVTALGAHALAINSNNTYATEFKLREILCSETSELTDIGEDCFVNQSNITKICLPPKVKVLKNSIFRPCENLSELIIFNNCILETIEQGAFYGTKITEIDLPQTVTTIGVHAFGSCEELETASIPTSAVNLSSSIFAYCTKLTSVTFSVDSPLTELPAAMFNGCTSLTNINIPKNVVKLGNNIFSNCIALNIDVSRFTSIGAGAFSGTGLTNVTLNADIQEIGSSAFASCRSLSSVIFADNPNGHKITKIEAYTFDGAASLSTITLPDSIVELGTRAFSYTGLVTVNLPANLQTIGDIAFFQFNSADSKLTTITDLQTLQHLTQIGESAFTNNDKLTITSLPPNIESIGKNAFRNTNINTNITIDPQTLTEIGEYAFDECGTSAAITVIGTRNDIPKNWNAKWAGSGSTATQIIYSEENFEIGQLFDGYSGYIDNNIIHIVNYVGDAVTLTLPAEHEGKTVIYESSVFMGNETIESVTLAANMTAIPNNFFADCPKLTTVIIPDEAKITYIGNYAFQDCSSLASFTIKDASELTHIGDYAFYRCYRLTYVDLIGNNKIEYIGDYAFATRLPTYNGALGRADIDMTHTRYIGDYAFYGNGSVNDVSLNASYTITSATEYIGKSAFENCRTLTITLKDGYKTSRFENRVFSQVGTLIWENVDFTDVTYIGDSAFSSTTALNNVKLTIPQTVTYIGDSAFTNCKLSSVKIIANNELRIGEYAFSANLSGFYLLIDGTPSYIGAQLCGKIKNAHIYFTETLTIEYGVNWNGTTIPARYILGNSDCEISLSFFSYDADDGERTDIPFFGAGQWQADENDEPIHPDDGHDESGKKQ